MLGFELRSAAQSGQLEAVKAILCDVPTAVDDTDTDCWSALHEAARNGETEVCFFLIKEAGAVVDLQNSNLNTPLHLAAEEGHEAVMRCLVECRAQVNLQNTSFHTPLHLAAAYGHEAACRFLVLSAGAQVDALSKNSNTPLMLATGNGHAHIVRFLIQEGRAQINLQNTCLHTPLHRAKMRGNEAIVKILMEFDPKLDVLNENQSAAVTIQTAGSVTSQNTTGLKSELGSIKADVENVKLAGHDNSTAVDTKCLPHTEGSVNEEWACSFCTVLNPAQVTVCECCGSLKTEGSVNEEWTCSFCTILNPAQVAVCECCGSLKTEQPAGPVTSELKSELGSTKYEVENVHLAGHDNSTAVDTESLPHTEQSAGPVASEKQKQEFEHTLNIEQKGFEDAATGLKSELGTTNDEVENVKLADHDNSTALDTESLPHTEQSAGPVSSDKQKQEFEHIVNIEQKGFEDAATGLNSELGTTNDEVENVKSNLADHDNSTAVDMEILPHTEQPAGPVTSEKQKKEFEHTVNIEWKGFEDAATGLQSELGFTKDEVKNVTLAGHDNSTAVDTKCLPHTKGIVNEEWTCSFCTVLNPAHALVCECCDTLKTEGVENEEWRCAACTLTNPAQATVCECCGAVKSENVENEEWKCNVCTLLNPAQETVCESCGSFKAEDVVTEEWKCLVCTLLNPAQETVCETCGSLKEEQEDSPPENHHKT